MRRKRLMSCGRLMEELQHNRLCPGFSSARVQYCTCNFMDLVIGLREEFRSGEMVDSLQLRVLPSRPLAVYSAVITLAHNKNLLIEHVVLP